MKKYIILLLCLLLSGCQKDSDAISVGVSFLRNADGSAMLPLNTEITMTMYNQKLLDKYAPQVEDYIHDQHKKIDRHDSYLDDEGNMIHNLKTVNESYGSHDFVQISEELFDMIQTSVELTKLSDGKFNLTIGAVSDLYEGKFASFPITTPDPDETSLKNALSCVVDPDDLDEVIELDEASTSVRLNTYKSCQGQVKLNISAYAKGAVLDGALKLLPRKDHKYMLNLGSSSQVLYAPENADKTWTIGIREPGTNQLLFVLGLKDEIMISTSADDQQYYLNEEGILRHHILDSKTGYSNNTYRSITVYSKKNAGILDALSTILFNADASERKQLVETIEKQYEMEIGYYVVEMMDNETFILTLDEESEGYLISNYNSDKIKEIRKE